MMFGTPTLLWRVLHFVGYYEPPLYHWNEEYLEGQPWYEVRLTIPARTQAPFWQEWRAESEGRTPQEATQVVAFEVLSQICQQHGDELIGSATGTFPRVDPSIAVWAQRNSNALIQDQDERADSSSPTMSAMFAVIKMFYTHQDTRDFQQECYTTCMDKLMRAKATQRKLKKHVRKHKKAASEARWETDQAYVALENLCFIV